MNRAHKKLEVWQENIAGGSLSELDTQIEIASNLKYLNNEQRQNFETRLESITKKLAGLISHFSLFTNLMDEHSFKTLKELSDDNTLSQRDISKRLVAKSKEKA